MIKFIYVVQLLLKIVFIVTFYFTILDVILTIIESIFKDKISFVRLQFSKYSWISFIFWIIQLTYWFNYFRII